MKRTHFLPVCRLRLHQYHCALFLPIHLAWKTQTGILMPANENHYYSLKLTLTVTATKRKDVIERLTTLYGKRQIFFESLNKSIRKIKNNSHVHDKRETTLFHFTYNGRRQKWNFAVRGINKCRGGHFGVPKQWNLFSLGNDYSFPNGTMIHRQLYLYVKFVLFPAFIKKEKSFYFPFNLSCNYVITLGKLSKLYMWFSHLPWVLFSHSALFVTWLFPSQ